MSDPAGKLLRQHGGPDAQGAARWDFSICANVAGPCPSALLAIAAADVVRYPDAGGQPPAAIAALCAAPDSSTTGDAA